MSVRPGCAPNNGAALNEGFRLRLVGQVSQLAMAQSCDLVRLSKNEIIL
jgi:hypothetical protein